MNESIMMKPWLIAGIQRFVVPPRLVTGQVLQQVHAQKIVTEQGFVGVTEKQCGQFDHIIFW